MSADRLRWPSWAAASVVSPQPTRCSSVGSTCVYEQADQLAEVGAGLGLAPNGMRIMRRLGLGEAAQDAEHMGGTRHAAASHLTARRKAGSLPAGNPWRPLPRDARGVERARRRPVHD